MKVIYCSLILFFLFITSSCDKNRVYDKSKKIPESNWKIGEVVKFDVQIADTVSYHNFYINIRNKTTYPYSNIYLFLNTTLPNNKLSRDTIECTLADPLGNWLGKGMGDVKDNQILFKKGFRFYQAGLYSFELEHALYDSTLTGISDIGIRIEKL